MLQELYYIKQYVGVKYLSLAARCYFKTMHHSIKKNSSCDHLVLHVVYCNIYTITKLYYSDSVLLT